jgi:formylglycine-generating enzyme required for sulfatase activity
VHPGRPADEVMLLFRVDMDRTFGERQAVETVAQVIRQARLEWVEPHPGRWIIHLDALKRFDAVRDALEGTPWFEGKAEVEPALRVSNVPDPMPGFMTPLPRSAAVALLIRREDLVQKIPNAFISYSWDGGPHKTWVRDLAARLRGDGVRTVLDRWETAPGDQLPHFMETAVRDNEFVLIVCTPKYKERSDRRVGGVGYEGDIMTGEVLTTGNRRKFIPILRHGARETSVPSWLGGAYCIDLRDGAAIDENYHDLLVTLYDAREKAPPIGPTPDLKTKPISPPDSAPSPLPPWEPIRITGILVDQVGTPRNDGSRGGVLYDIPFKLSREPSAEWANAFIEQWNHPPEWTPRHRPGIASVRGDRIILDSTTVEEVEQSHRKTLVLAAHEANRIIEGREAKERLEAEQRRDEQRRHEEAVRAVAKRISFDPPDRRAEGILDMKLKLIPAGEFLMGSPESDKDAQIEEKPQHRVRITQPFYLGIYQVTRGQFRRFVDTAGYHTEAEKDGNGGWSWDPARKWWVQDPKITWRSPDFDQTDDHPVVTVSWNDASAFCDWLSQKEGQKYRLPTEAEWEYACRAGTRTRYYSGDDPESLVAMGNVADATAKATFPDWPTIGGHDGYVYTAPVGQFRPNDFGLYDMHGNVWEWC